MKKQKRANNEPETLREILLSAGGTEMTDDDFDALVWTFGGDDASKPENEELAEQDDIDSDDWDLRPVNFDPRTGKRLNQGSRAAATAMERFDIQEDKHYCVWCGIRISRHYSSWSQWIPCVELVKRNTAALVAARKKAGR